MRLTVKTPPREFTVGAAANIVLRDCMTIGLEPGESLGIIGPSDKNIALVAAWKSRNINLTQEEVKSL